MTTKVLAYTALVCMLLAALLLVWFAEQTTCGATTRKMFTTVFIIAALTWTRVVAKMK